MSKARRISPQSQRLGAERKALVYCRVSSDRQKTEGHGLESQEQRCKEYAKSKKYEVTKVFKDSFTGGGDYLQRPALSEMLDYISKNAHTDFVVVFDDLKRLARDTVSHWQLREHLSKLGATVESPNFEFKEDDDSSWMHEAINAVFNENERRTNRRQVIQKQKARLESGYWAFGARRGFRMEKNKLHGKLLTPVEPDASILREALEGFATGRFLHKVDVCEFLVKNSFWKKQKPERYIDKLTTILTDPLYAGDIAYPMWGIERRKGHHVGIISREVFAAIQDRLERESSGKRTRVDVSEDFPLRGITNCSDCGRKMTGAWTSGSGGKYAYYFCQNNDCEMKRQSIPKDVIENEFSSLLQDTMISEECEKLIGTVFDKVWKSEVKYFQEETEAQAQKIHELGESISRLSSIVAKTDSLTLQKTYELEIEKLAVEREELEGGREDAIDYNVPYRTAIQKAVGLLKSPYAVWSSVNVVEKQKLFYFIFDENLAYSKKAGYRTDKLPYAAKLFEDFVISNERDVDIAPKTWNQLHLWVLEAGERITGLQSIKNTNGLLV